ncbi:MAG: alkyl sulfatase dimerization domain-containing protein [Acidimicrobiales bacterium]
MSEKKRESILNSAFEPTTVTTGVHLVATQGNGVVIEQADGLVIVDAGPGGGPTDQMITDVRSISDRRVKAIVYSHGHVGYNAGVAQWRAHAAERGEAEPERIGHANVVPRLMRYTAMFDNQVMLNQWQFPRARRASLERGLAIEHPSVTFDDRLVLDDADCPIEIFWAPSETDDCVALWLPKQQLLYTGPSVIPGFPNIGTPLRIQRLTQRWIDTLEAMRELGAETMIPEFGDVVVGVDAVAERLSRNIDALRWLLDETLARLNRGMTDVEILHDLEYPSDLFDAPYLVPSYGSPDYVVRDIVRENSGWWSRDNPTDLHPAHPDDAAAAVLAAVDPATVIAAARTHQANGDLQLAMHVIDLVALAPSGEPSVIEARELKAELCAELARQTEPFVSRSLYFGFARLYRAGKVRWSQAPDGLDALEAASGV